ncbi:NADase-type glycan-binding domain-containing protein [Subtercola sp. YIM 133946]|uniref:NADase-type glycan-binding domain-containing protein n=1 Tax=Subtercola sp. YIM 133946 TaxID=3118909 RepID=UPI002F94F103
MAKRERSSGWVARDALIAAVISGLLVGVPSTVIASNISGQFAQSLANQATCANPQDLTLLSGNSISATGASLSYPTTSGTFSYPPDQLVDGTRSTAWVSADTATLGVGSTVTLTLPHDVDLRLICVLNGYAKGADYEMNASVQVVEVATDRGKRDATLPALTADNAFDYQPLAFTPGKTSTVTLTMLVVDPPVHPDPSEGPVSATMSEVELWTSSDSRDFPAALLCPALCISG